MCRSGPKVLGITECQLSPSLIAINEATDEAEASEAMEDWELCLDGFGIFFVG